jgi:hypothetical protein
VRDVLYDDGGVVLDDDGLTIRRYYFPWAGPKHIPYSAIRHVVAKRMNSLTGRGRGWGTSDFGHWFPLDIGARVKPCVSPDDPQRVIELLRERAHID